MFRWVVPSRWQFWERRPLSAPGVVSVAEVGEGDVVQLGGEADAAADHRLTAEVGSLDKRWAEAKEAFTEQTRTDSVQRPAIRQRVGLQKRNFFWGGGECVRSRGASKIAHKQAVI